MNFLKFGVLLVYLEFMEDICEDVFLLGLFKNFIYLFINDICFICILFCVFFLLIIF